MEKYRFCFQDNQFTGECLPCTASQFKTIVNSDNVNRKIGTRQAVEKAIDEGESLTPYISDASFRNFCQRESQKPRSGAAFAALPVEKKLKQWTNSMKMCLPCLIFGVREFKGTHRKQSEIKELSGLFMFDADHLPCDPRSVYERTKRHNFPWPVRLAHGTSSGYGLRLVCEAIPDVGNIADNQIELGRELGLLGMLGTTGKPVCDDSCIDACRISYAPRMCDIYYIDEEKLFNF